MAKKGKLKLSFNNIVTSIVYAVIGLMLVILRGGSLNILMSVVGALLVVLGIVDMVKGKELTKGIIEAVVGVAIIVCGWLVADIVLLVLGVLLIVKGAIELFKNFKNGWAALLSAIVTIVIGVLLVIAKWMLMDVICLIAGIVFLVNAVLALFGKRLKK